MKKTLQLSFFSVLAFIAIAGLTQTAHANTPAFQRAQSAPATTTRAFLSAGLGTTTSPVYDAGVGNSLAADGAALAVQYTGSSTASILNVDLEYAQGGGGVDCVATPTACDWYRNNLGTQATTSPVQSITTKQSFSLQFASSSTQGGVAGITPRNNVLITVSMPMRYVRAVYTVPIGALAGAVWSEFVGKKQIQ